MVGFRADILSQLLALPFPHGEEAVGRFGQDRLDSSPDSILIGLRLADGKNVVETGQTGRCDVGAQVVRAGEFLHGVEISLGERVIDADFNGVGGDFLKREVTLNFAAGDPPLQIRLDLLFQEAVRPGDPGPQFKIPVVYALELDEDRVVLVLVLGSAISGHAFCHMFVPL